jgi:hypothetical protein
MDKKVNLWRNTSGELMLVPYQSQSPSRIWSATSAPGPANWPRCSARTRTLKGRFPAAVTKKDLVGTFGEVKTWSGLSIREIVGILPVTAQYPPLDQMVEDVAERNAATIRVTEGAAAALGVVWGADRTTAYSNIPVANLTMVSGNVKAALIKNNVKTMSDLAKLDPQKFADMTNAEEIKETANFSDLKRSVCRSIGESIRTASCYAYSPNVSNTGARSQYVAAGLGYEVAKSSAAAELDSIF